MWSIEASSFGGVGIGEVDNAYDREFTFLLDRTNTVGFKLQSAHPLAPYLATMKVLIKLYFGRTLMFHGPVVSYTRSAEAADRSISVVAADPSWFFAKRLIGKTAAGYVQPTITDRGQIWRTLLDAANVEGETGIRTGAENFLSGSTSTYSSGAYKPMQEALADLSTGVYGFDWEIKPIDWLGGKIGDWHADPLLGVFREDVIFEYGHGSSSNIKSVTDTGDRSGQANKVYHISSTGPDAAGTPVAVQSDATAITNWGLMEDLAEADLIDNTLRQTLVDEHVRIRKNPRRIVVFTPNDFHPSDPGNVPVFGSDYILGDMLRARAKDESGEWFDGLFRVYGYTSKPNETGIESGDILFQAEESG